MTERMVNHPEQVDALVASLDQIPRYGDTHRTVVPWYLFTNDVGYGALLPQISAAVTAQTPKEGVLRASLLSGTGGLLSIAPDIPVDLFIIADNNHFVPEAMTHAVSLAQWQPTPQEYAAAMLKSPYAREVREAGHDPWAWFEIDAEAMGEKHYAASQERYEAMQQALRTIPVFTTVGNFANQEYLMHLWEALQKNNIEIAHAHMTDVTDWHPEILQTIATLPFREDAVISWSTNTNRPDEKPEAQLSIGVDAYIAAAQQSKGGEYFKRYES